MRRLLAIAALAFVTLAGCDGEPTDGEWAHGVCANHGDVRQLSIDTGWSPTAVVCTDGWAESRDD
jgi:hypothetical protein